MSIGSSLSVLTVLAGSVTGYAAQRPADVNRDYRPERVVIRQDRVEEHQDFDARRDADDHREYRDQDRDFGREVRRDDIRRPHDDEHRDVHVEQYDRE